MSYFVDGTVDRVCLHALLEEEPIYVEYYSKGRHFPINKKNGRRRSERHKCEGVLPNQSLAYVNDGWNTEELFPQKHLFTGRVNRACTEKLYTLIYMGPCCFVRLIARQTPYTPEHFCIYLEDPDVPELLKYVNTDETYIAESTSSGELHLFLSGKPSRPYNVLRLQLDQDFIQKFGLTPSTYLKINYRTSASPLPRFTPTLPDLGHIQHAYPSACVPNQCMHNSKITPDPDPATTPTSIPVACPSTCTCTARAPSHVPAPAPTQTPGCLCNPAPALIPTPGHYSNPSTCTCKYTAPPFTSIPAPVVAPTHIPEPAPACIITPSPDPVPIPIPGSVPAPARTPSAYPSTCTYTAHGPAPIPVPAPACTPISNSSTYPSTCTYQVPVPTLIPADASGHTPTTYPSTCSCRVSDPSIPVPVLTYTAATAHTHEPAPYPSTNNCTCTCPSPVLGHTHLPDDQLKEGVLARWDDDRWYYKGHIVSSEENGWYRVRDLTDREEWILKENIIWKCQKLSDDACYVLAPHPVSPWRYAPGCILDINEYSVTVVFYDNRECRGIREFYPYDSHTKYCQDVKAIRDREKDLEGKEAIIRNDSSGFYEIGTVIQQIGCDQRYRVELDSGIREQRSSHIYRMYTGSHTFKENNYVLACVDRDQVKYLPGQVKQTFAKTLTVEFVNRKRLTDVSIVDSYWMNERNYLEAKAFYLKLHPEFKRDFEFW